MAVNCTESGDRRVTRPSEFIVATDSLLLVYVTEPTDPLRVVVSV